jgi:chromosome segregation ATPase
MSGCGCDHCDHPACWRDEEDEDLDDDEKRGSTLSVMDELAEEGKCWETRLEKAERERDEWKAKAHEYWKSGNRWADAAKKMQDARDELQAEVERLKAEIERLRLVFGKENTALREEVERLKKYNLNQRTTIMNIMQEDLKQ